MGKGSKYCPCCNAFLSDESGEVIGFHAHNCPIGNFEKKDKGGWSTTSGEWKGMEQEGTGFTPKNYFVHVVPNPSVPVPTGWVCPKCGKVWAPTVKMCESCNPPYTIITYPPYGPYKEYPYGTTTDAKDSSTPTDSQDEGKISCYLHNQ